MAADKFPHAAPLQALLTQVRHCNLCAAQLPLGPRPVLQAAAGARILIVGQAPGRRAHEAGIPFDDASGERLRSWLGVSRAQFYDPAQIAILPIGFCYPGSTRSGDLPPRPECAPTWHPALLAQLPAIELTLLLGRYAQARYLPAPAASVTEAVQRWRESWPALLALPHPSPRNNLWLRRNPWFETELLPQLRDRVVELLRR